MGRDEVKKLTIPPVNVSKRGVAKPSGFLQHGGKYRFELARRTADNLKHFRRRCLLLQRRLVRARSFSSRAFSMAMTAWLAKFFTSSICFSVKGRTSGRWMCDDANRLVVFEHWHGDDSANAAKFNCFDYPGMTLGVRFCRCQVR